MGERRLGQADPGSGGNSERGSEHGERGMCQGDMDITMAYLSSPTLSGASDPINAVQYRNESREDRSSPSLPLFASFGTVRRGLFLDMN